MQLEEQIKAMGDRELLEFNARLMASFLDNCKDCRASLDLRMDNHQKRLKRIENSDRRATLIGVVIGSAVSLIVSIGGWFIKKPQ
jgi:hypothetical protein